MLQRAEDELIENKGEIFDSHLPPASTAENDLMLHRNIATAKKTEEDKLKKKRKRDENTSTNQATIAINIGKRINTIALMINSIT